MSKSVSDPSSEPQPKGGMPRGILLRLWDFIWSSVIRVLWLCAYATVASVGVAVLFAYTGQGQDLLRISAERGPSVWNVFFLLGALLLGLTLWYTSRLLLNRDFKGESIDRSRSRFGREWLPRLFGTLVPLSIGIGFMRVNTQAQMAAWALGAAFLLLAVLMLWFFVKRRTWFLRGSTQGLDASIPSLGWLNWVLIAIGIGASYALLLAFVASPVDLPQLIGTPGIVLLGFAGITLFGGLVLTYAFLANGQPSGTLFVLVLAAVFGLFNDNHWIRVDDGAPALARRDAGTQYLAWRQAHPLTNPIDGREPVILVAASGGGIRAAYWTASTLATLEAMGGFSDNLFSLSGVSGGSVGAAVYAAIKRQQLDGSPVATLPEVRRVLGSDFLSPLVAGFLFPDLAQRFVPIPFAEADRQRFLELGFERGLSAGESPLSRSFTALYADGYETRLPSLLLNTTVVDSGRRAVLSNIALAGFTDTLDLLDSGFGTQQARLSAAAGASARFTYLSPAGSLKGQGEKGEQKIRVVDGGYFENSGAATTSDLLSLLPVQQIYPILILIRNTPSAPPVCQGRGGEQPLGPGPAGPPASDVLSEVASPIRALLNARDARGRLAEVDAAKRVEEVLAGAVIEVSLAAVMHAELDAAPDDKTKQRIERSLIEPPLGWSLSEAVRGAMDRTLDKGAGGLAEELGILKAVLGGDTGAYRPCKPR